MGHNERSEKYPIVARWNVGDDSPDHYVLDTRIKGKSDIDPDGTAHISDETGTYTMKLDGTIGRQVNLDKEGRVSEVYYPNGDKLSVINGFGPPIIARWTRVEGAPPGVYNLVGRIPGKASVTRDGTLTVEDANGKHITTIDGRTEHRK